MLQGVGAIGIVVVLLVSVPVALTLASGDYTRSDLWAVARRSLPLVIIVVVLFFFLMQYLYIG